MKKNHAAPAITILAILTIVVTSATVTAQAPPPPVRGFADLHNHQFANLGFGGKMMFGKPFSPAGIADAVGWCDSSHGGRGLLDLIGMAAGQGFGHAVGGFPLFDGWPMWYTKTHQQVYVDWLKRAVDGGLRLMVMHAVNNEILCGISNKEVGRTCNDMEAVDLQIQGAKALEAYVDSISGGPGTGWYRIAYTPAQARQIASSGKLAVVLGIEVDSLFNCGVGSTTCDNKHVKDELQRYYAMGVRHIFPVHVFNNAFGGAALYSNDFNTGNKLVTGDWFDARDCYAEGYRFNFQTSFFGTLVTLLTLTPPPTYPGNAQCNTVGLTTLGEGLIRKMMSRKVVIDVDHLSARGVNRALELAESQDYPGIVSGHSGVLAISIGEKRSEGQRSDSDIDRIVALGGLIAPILHQGTTSEVGAYTASPVVPNDCGESSHSWAQAYMYVKAHSNGGAVALGSDFNGLAGEPAPRFGPDECHGDKKAPQTGGVSYPFVADTGTLMFRSVIGGDATNPPRIIDYNGDGLAHVGLLPDMIEDLRSSGLSSTDLDPLYHSAEAYIAMWEQMDAMNIFPPSSTFAQTPVANGEGWNDSDVAVTIEGVEDPDGMGVHVRYASAGAIAIPTTDSNAPSVQLGVDQEGISTLTFYAFDNAGNHEQPQTRIVRLDKTTPAVNCPSPDLNWHAADAVFACIASDAVSGLADPAQASFNLETAVPDGTETADASTGSRTVADKAGNASTAGPFTAIKIDKKAPAISITSPESRTYLLNQVVTATYSCSDGGSGVATCNGPAINGANINTTAAGLHSFTVTANDNVGNGNAASANYTVAYAVKPLYAVVAKQSGSTYPIKLQLTDAAAQNVSSAAIVVHAVGVVLGSTDTSAPLDDAGNANPDSDFRYDAALGGYIFNLSLAGYQKGTYTLQFTAGSDPTIHGTAFQVK